MIETRGLRGLVPVVQTPLYEDGSIDEEGQTKLIEWLGGLPVGGYWVLGTGSEDMNLSFDKRLQAARVACAANAGKKPLILGTGFFALDDIFAFIDATADLEFDAYHVMPYHPLLGHARLDWFYRQIADYCRKPLWMYYSSNWSKKVSPEFVAALKDHPNIAGIKFSSRDTIDQIKIMALANDSFQAITAVIGQYYAALCIGAKASTTSVAGALPEPLLEIYDLYMAGRHADSLTAQQRFLAFVDDMPKTLKQDNFLGAAEEKYVLSLRGICQPFTSSYYRDADADERAQIDAALEKHGMLPFVPTFDEQAKASVG